MIAPLPADHQSPPASEDALIALLVARGACDGLAAERARRVAAETGRGLQPVLIQLGLVSEKGLADALSVLLGLPLATADDYPEEPLFPGMLAPRFLRDVRALPVSVAADGAVVVAAADPLDGFVAHAIGLALGRRVRLRVALPIELEAAFDRLYRDDASAPGEGTAGDEALEEDSERLKDLASEAPVVRLVSQIINRAVETRASDIHVEPMEDRLRIRYRHDGVLQEVASHPKQLAAAIVSRIKILARLDIAQRRLPQDGRIRLAVRGHEIDFRVSTVPALHGEAMVLRVLDRSAVEFDFARLGLARPVVERFSAALQQPNGVVLVTGPTGSGKTTTLYTGLLALNAATRKIITIEDPVEYHLAGINQIQVRPQIGLDFAALLRAILRQDPDVVMVGEIRDVETAQIAAQAALTGHLVLSTVHTNSAAATLTRLRDMGLQDYLLAAVLRGVLAQRLVRALCVECRREEAVPDALVAHFALEARTTRRPVTYWRAVGCPACRGTGYRGRRAIAEFLVPDATIERLIGARADEAEIERAAVAAGMVTMREAGLDAVLDGVTSLEEVMRSTGAEPT
jgi:general secretion pathway protein E